MSELSGPRLPGAPGRLSRAAVVRACLVMSGPITATIAGEKSAGSPWISTHSASPSMLSMLSVAYMFAESEHTSYSL